MDRPQRLARRQEKKGAASYGARLTPMSGSGDVKGDALADDELIEFKHTEKKSFYLKLADLRKFATQAIIAGKRMVFEVEFTLPDGTHPWKFVILNRDEYIEMKQQIVDLKEEVNFAAGAEVYPEIGVE